MSPVKFILPTKFGGLRASLTKTTTPELTFSNRARARVPELVKSTHNRLTPVVCSKGPGFITRALVLFFSPDHLGNMPINHLDTGLNAASFRIFKHVFSQAVFTPAPIGGDFATGNVRLANY